MSLSRKRKRELKKLRSHAQDVLNDQKVVLDQAKHLMFEAGVQAKNLSNEHVAPRVNEAYETVRPTVERVVRNIRRVAAPAVTTALISAINTLDASDNPRAHRASQRILQLSNQAGLKVKKPKKRSARKVIALSVGLAAAAGVAYTLWQTFRADDELWIAADDSE
ncbi:DNA/RNA helicase [Lysinibacter sp. HNR]|uniref:DNA/RNA helicase n=1 Tax=Lysinibacter sp. HNR TaxID=3031408 RepID=UPI0024355786|nr:DNA/RNA helicase [Lysinibacter sp. HNR]WGD37353.1 DNA/RNA helicase [Lysinibacter sp. HNR]